MDSKSTIQVHGSASQERDRPHPSAVPNLGERTDALIRGLRLVVRLHNASTEIQDLLEEQVRRYLGNCVSERVWLEQTKYLLALPLARYLRNEEPKAPAPLKFTGPFKRWFQVRIKVFSTKNTHLWYSWFQCKRACLPVSEKLIFSTYKKHLATLTSPDRGDPSITRTVLDNPTFREVLEDVRHQLNGEYAGAFQQTEDHHASLSACYESSRKTEGTHGLLRRAAGIDINVTINTVSSYEMFLSAYGRHPRPDDNESLSQEKIIPRFSLGTIVSKEHELLDMTWIPYIYERGKKITNYLYSRIVEVGGSAWVATVQGLQSVLHRAYGGPQNLHAMIQAVVEPCKVRVISKGEALPYYESKRLQRALHSSLRNRPCFRLIGRTLEDTDVSAIAFKSLPTWEWFSIDYSSATDYLSYAYSKEIFEYLIQDLPKEVQDLSKKVLGPHHLFYPMDLEAKVDDEDVPLPQQTPNHRLWWKTPSYGGLQTSGQLMGSPLSFPILCLANLGVYLQVTQDLHQGWTTEERLASVLVNGDDMLYAAPKDLWEKHISIGRSVGLEMSLGKAYHHPIYSNINSMGFHLDIRRGRQNPIVRRVPFLNTGLFFLQRKVLSKDGNLAVPDDDPVESLNEILNGCYDEQMKCRVLAQYLSQHSFLLKKRTMVSYDTPWTEKSFGSKHQHLTVFFRNLFIHRSLGGMGVNLPDGFKTKITRRQKRLALSLAEPVMRYPSALVGQGPLPSDDLKVVREVEKPWSSKYSAEARKIEEEISLESLISSQLPRLRRWESFSESLKTQIMGSLHLGVRSCNTLSVRRKLIEQEGPSQSNRFPCLRAMDPREVIPQTSGSYGVAGSNRPKIGCQKELKKILRYQKRQKKVPSRFTTVCYGDFDEDVDHPVFRSPIEREQVFLDLLSDMTSKRGEIPAPFSVTEGPWLSPWELARNFIRGQLRGVGPTLEEEEYERILSDYWGLKNEDHVEHYCREQSVPRSLFFGFWDLKPC